MFNRKISKKLNENQNQRDYDLEHERIVAKINQEEQGGRLYLPLSGERPEPSTGRSHNRIAAGFDPVGQASSSSRSPKNPYRDEYESNRSNNEVREEFDVDDAENLQYPRQAYPPNDLLLEEYSGIMKDSSEAFRGTDMSQQRLPPPLSPQVSIGPLQGRTASSKSIDKLNRRSSRSSRIERIKEEVEDSDENMEEPLRYGGSDFMRNSGSNLDTTDSLGGSRVPSRTNSIKSRRIPGIFNTPSYETPGVSSDNPSNMGSVTNSITNNASTSDRDRDRDRDRERERREPLSNFSQSYNRLNSNNQIQNSNTTSRDVIPLPIEIPDSVTDADAFRRYLSVRRGAIFPSNNDERSTIESLGGGRNSQLPERNRSASQMIPPSFVNSSSSLQPLRPPLPDLPPNPPPPPVNLPPTCGSNIDPRIHRRTASLSHAIMTLALLSASAAQLRFVIAYSHAHAYPTLNYFLICSCIIIEVLVGIGFVVLARFDFSEAFQDKLHSYLIFGLFVITVANVIVAAFALDDHICEVLIKRSVQNAVQNGNQNGYQNGLDPNQNPYEPQLMNSLN